MPITSPKYKCIHLRDVRAEQTIQALLNQLEYIDEDQLTTFELNFLRQFAINPPHRERGAEDRIIDN